jgi:hypothetical protein
VVNFPNLQFLAQAGHDIIHQLDDFESAVDEIFNLATTWIDHFFPRFKLDCRQVERTYAFNKWTIMFQMTRETFES